MPPAAALGYSVWWVSRFTPANGPTDEQIDEWIRNERARVMYRDESRID